MDLFKAIGSEKNDKISKMMSDCFDEPISTVNFFLENKREDSKCYICENEKDVISLLHAIPYKININNNYFKCLYIYGACTKSIYRRQGYMSKLIKFCEEESKSGRVDFLALVPENKHLESYYYSLGYRNFFKIKEINLNKKDLLKFCCLANGKKGQQNENNNIYDKKFYKNIENLRCNIYNGMSGILYSAKDLEYAINLYKFFGGKFVNSEYGYAICVPEEADTLEIKDFTSKNEFIPDLLQKIYDHFPDFANYKIKTYASDNFFNGNDKTYFYGMIKPLSGFAKKVLEDFYLNKKDSAYLGLALD